jgi:hypothetical protein
MNLNHVLAEIEKVDPEVYDKLDTRRSALKGFSKIGQRLTLAAIPIAFGSLFKKAYGQSSTAVVLEILNYALTLEYLEAEFYATAVSKFAQIGVPAGPPQGAIQTISTHETAHVNFLKAAITGAGGTPVAKPTFDFSAGSGSGTGPFKDVFSNYALFLAVAQTFEDTGVRAYKGRAAELVKGGDVLKAALRIHSIEARHASHIRQMRKNGGFGTSKPWITLNDTGGIGAAVQASYNGEENTMQGSPAIQITGINGQTAITAEAASESFDEGLTKAQVLAIVGPFIKA